MSMENKSIWRSDVELPSFEPLNKDMKTHVLIIGGGMAGILCAWMLQQAGIDYLLVEGNRIGCGVTGDTTAKVTSQHGLIYGKLLKNAGYEKARMYLSANHRAVAEFRTLAQTISCDFEQKDAYVYSLTDRSAIEREVDALSRLSFPAQFTDRVPLPFDVAGAVKFEGQAQFHPLKLIAGLAKRLNICEHTFVRELAPRVAVTNRGTIHAEHIIVAAHFPFLNKHGGYFLKMYQHRSYAIALENAPDVGGMYLEEREDGLSFRNYQNLLIIGGGDHKTGKQGGNWRVLREFAETAFPDAVERYAWATQDCMTLDGVPYIGKYAKNIDGLYVATGFNKWGMSTSMVAAMLLAHEISGKKSEYAELFSPQRSMMKPQLLVNGASSLTGFLNPGGKRCPHLGCKLKWNKVERSWDCPCHGSRFDEKGGLIDNPATGDLGNR